MRALIGLIIGLAFLLLGALFTGANDVLVKFDYLLGEFEWALSYLLLSSFIAGAVITFALLLPVYLRWKTEKSQMNRRLKRQQKELENLRILPIQNDL